MTVHFDFLLVAKAITEEQRRQLTAQEPLDMGKLERVGMAELHRQHKEGDNGTVSTSH